MLRSDGLLAIVSSPGASRHGRVRHAWVVLGTGLLACGEIAQLHDPADEAPTDGIVQNSADLSVTPSELVFPDLACGTEPEAPQVLTLHNQGSSDLPYEVRLPEGTPFSFRGASSGIVKASDVALVSLSAKPQAAEQSSIDAVVKIGTSIFQIPVRVTGNGGELEITPVAADFGDVRYTVESAAIPIELRNIGNVDVTMSPFEGVTADFSLAFPPEAAAPPKIAAGGTIVVHATMHQGAASAVPLTAVVTPHASGVCGAIPTITLSGRRVNDDVTITPATADFGDQPCTTTPTITREIVVSNYSTSRTASYDASLPANSRFTIASGGKGTIPVAASLQTAQTASIVLEAKTVTMPLADVTEDLTITIDPPLPDGETTRIVKVTMRPVGAILSVTPASINGFSKSGQQGFFAITNTGNAKTTVGYTATGNAFVVEADDVLTANAVGDIAVTFKPPQKGTFSSTVKITRMANGMICNTPPNLTVKGTLR